MRSKFKWIFTLLVALTMQFSFAQKTVTGKVSDASGPLPGANVVVKGTKNATSTDFDGTYSIKAKEGDVLVFSFVGKEGKVATVGAGNVYNATLNAVEELTTVVVSGAFGIKKSKNAQTSSQQLVTNKELTNAANPNVIQSLAGKVSGLQITTTNSGVNAGTRITLRGIRTITANGEALVVIDNSISTAAILTQLPPEVIESVNVIKGQQGSALYGEQGSNGVIIVTTKKGTGSEKPVISISSSLDFETIAFTPDRQTRYGQGWYNETGANYTDAVGPNPQLSHIPIENGSWGPAFNAPGFEGTNQATGLPQADGKFLRLPWKSLGSDNIKPFFKTGTLFQTGVSLNMGGESGYAFISANRQNTNFLIEGDKLVRTSFLFKGGKKIGKFSIGGIANYSNESVSQTDSSLYFDLLNTATNIPVELYNSGVNQNHWTVYNKSPYWKQKNIRFDDVRNTLNGSMNFGYEFNKNINVSYNANIQVRNAVSEFHNNGDLLDQSYNVGPGYSYFGDPFSSYFAQGGTSTGSSYFIQNTLNTNIYADLLLNLNYQLTDNIGFKGLIGNNIQDNKFVQQTSGGTNLNTPGLYNINNVINQGAVNADALTGASYTPFRFYDSNFGNKLENSNNRLRRVAFFANTDFNYKDYLFLNATARYEQTSNIKTSQFYPSVGISFIPTLAFDGLKGNNILNYLKINASYSVTGNSTPVRAQEVDGIIGNVGAGYPFTNSLSFTYPSVQTFADTKGEFVKTAEFGLSLGFFKNRFTFGVSAYKSEVTDLITNRGVSRPAGYALLKSNIGSLENKGYDLDFGFNPIKTQSFSWDLKVNLSFNSTIVTSLADGVNEISLNTFTGGGVFAVVGEEFPMLKGNSYQRSPDGQVVVGANGIPLLNTSLQNLGKATPDYILGITNSFEYKGLRLSAVIDYRSGGKIYSGTKRDLTFTGATQESADFDRTKGYIFPNSVQVAGGGFVTNNTVAGGVAAQNTNGSGAFFSGNYLNIAENMIVDATFFKVRELALSYSLPSKVLEPIGLTSFKFGVNARNFFTLLGNPFKGRSSYSNQGFSDPEASNSNATRRNANATGVADQTQYPSSKTVGFSINLTF
jgi:TonB-linked SusC/RagA family outer membrane protein